MFIMASSGSTIGFGAVQTPAQPEDIWTIAQPKSPEALASPLSVQSANKHSVSMDQESLLAQPELLEQALDSSIVLKDLEAIQLLLPLYQRLPQPDQVLIEYAQATLARLKGQHKQAIERYDTILENRPDLTPIKLERAVALFENQQLSSAQNAFKQLQQASVPETVEALIEEYREVIDQKQNWQMSFNMTYLQDQNINNAPKKQTHEWGDGQLLLPKKESAHGLGYALNVTKDWMMPNDLTMKFGLDHYGKWYWDNHAYDDFFVRASLGMGYRRLKTEVNVLPFIGKRWFGGEAYSDHAGVRIEWNQWVSPKVQSLSAIEFGRNQYPDRSFLNGHDYSWSQSILFVVNEHRYWLLGGDYYKATAEDDSEAYVRHNARIAFGQAWANGLATQVHMNRAERRYQAQDFFGIKRKDIEYGLGVALWKKDSQFFGLTPRLTAHWQKIDSNHFLYGYQKARVMLEMNRRF